MYIERKMLLLDDLSYDESVRQIILNQQQIQPPGPFRSGL